MNLILHYWFLAPSLCVALATAYFTYRVLIGYVNTPEKALKRVFKTKDEFVCRRANSLCRVCECDGTAAMLGIYLPPCDYCKGLKLGARKEKSTPF